MILHTLPFILLLFHPITSSPPFLPQTTNFETRQQIIPLSRLPRAIFPSHYTVELQPILDEGHGVRFTCPGKVWINFSCLFGATNITLQSLGITINHDTVEVYEFPSLIPVPITSFSNDTEKEQFVIHTGEMLRPGGVYRLYIEFTTPVSTQLLSGLYLSNYTDNGETHYLATTDLEATDARRVFPCFDEPDLKATFDVTILRLPHYHSLANMNLLRTEEIPNLPGWLKDTFDRTEFMSTYLFCIAVSDFEMEEASPGLHRKPVRVWGPPPYMRIGAGTYSPDITAKLLTALENYYQVNYTFPKMDKIAVPHFSSGAMENWGLNTYRLNRLLIEEGVATVQDRVSAASTLSHELVHQWFGNLVTLRWWDDLWLNEGFASYYSEIAMQDIGLHDMLPLDTLVSDAVQRAMQYDATNATHPIHYEVLNPTEIRIMFDTITYSKGAALVRMMNAILTEPVMRRGLTAYLKKYDHQNAHQDDLFNTLDLEASSHPTPLLPNNMSLKEIMDDWTLQSGFPVLRITRTPGSPSIKFQQYKYRDESSIPDDGTKWSIPISIQTSSDVSVDSSPKLWLLRNDTLKFYASDANVKWVIVNPQQTGYYRVSYNEASLKEIIEQLHQDHTVFDPQTRSALVDDNLKLAFAGYFQVEHALNLTLYLRNERHLVPWTSFLNNMVRPNKMLGRGFVGGNFRNYVVGLVRDTLRDIGLDPQVGEPVGNGTILRNKLFEWACNFGDSECVGYSVGKFREWMGDTGKNSIIFPDLRPFVYCTAVANVLSEYRKPGHREVTRLNLLRSLGCSRSAYRLSLLLDLAIDPTSGIDESHRITAIQAVVGNTAGVDITFDFVRNRVSTITRRFGPSFVASVITALGDNLNKAYDIGDLERFVGDNEQDLGSVKGTIDNAVNMVHSNVRWMQRNEGQFGRFLRGLV